MPGTAHSPGPPVAAAGGVQQRGGIKGKRRQGKIRRTGCTQGHSAACCRDDEIPRPRAPCARVACGRHSLHAFGGCGVLKCLQVWLRGHVAKKCSKRNKNPPASATTRRAVACCCVGTGVFWEVFWASLCGRGVCVGRRGGRAAGQTRLATDSANRQRKLAAPDCLTTSTLVAPTCGGPILRALCSNSVSLVVLCGVGPASGPIIGAAGGSFTGVAQACTGLLLPLLGLMVAIAACGLQCGTQ